MVTPETNRIATIAGARAFLTEFKSLQLATTGESGQPLASYAPFALLESGELGVFISELAGHTANLQANPMASVMLIEPEQKAANIFARKRLVCQCTAHFHPVNSTASQAIIAALQIRAGDTVLQLAQLSDFHTVSLSINSASYVTGFAQAFHWSGEEFNF